MSEEVTKKKSDIKKSYGPPVLRVYGTMQDLTRTAAATGAQNDVRGPAMDLKTH